MKTIALFNSHSKIKSNEPAPLSLKVLTFSGMDYSTVLRNINTEWSLGEMVGIIGPNGAGKSTLLRVAAGIGTASRGEVLLHSKNITTLPSAWRAKEIAYMPQHIPDQVPYTVLEYVEMGRFAYRNAWGGLSRESKRIVQEAIHRANLTAYLHNPLSDLSGGERQRAAIARCLAQGSRIILLDEPIASLDLYYQVEILQQLKQLAESGYLVVLVLHNLELAARYCSRLLVLKEGRIYSDGAPEEVLTEHAMQEVFHVQMKLFKDPYSGDLRLSYL